MDPNLLPHSPVIGQYCSNTDNTIISITSASKADKANAARLSHELCMGSGYKQFLLFNVRAANRRLMSPRVRVGGAGVGKELQDGMHERGFFQDKYWDLSWLGIILVSFCNKLPQIWWLKNRRHLFSHSSGAQKSKIKVLRLLVLSGGSARESAHASLWLLPMILGVPGLMAA